VAVAVVVAVESVSISRRDDAAGSPAGFETKQLF
jgi:hypothetical protein